jgi:hypothetical protein
MSFEIDEHRLAHPPVKCDQEVITCFWGIYRWPFKNYNRYSQLEGLEQTADETRTMAKALQYICKAKELGLSMDGGLGWIAGPDFNQRVVQRGEKPAVFGESRFVPEQPKKLGRPSSTSQQRYSAHTITMRQTLQRMLEDVGYTGLELEQYMGVMMEQIGEEEQIMEAPPQDEDIQRALENTRRTALWAQSHRPMRPLASMLLREDENEITDDGDADEWMPLGGVAPAPASAAGLFMGAVANNANPGLDPVANGLALGDTAIDLDRESVRSRETTDDEESPRVRLNHLNRTTKAKVDYSLKPNDLSNAQKEMLLELEWAQAAFIQSYAIAIIDNHLSFTNVESITIARVPSRHLANLCRQDFWDSLPQLKKFSLAVIPDWRHVVKESAAFVQDIRIAPSLSIPGAYEMLRHVSDRKNIQHLHFEWLCGGEYAPGLFSRNQHILAAPVVSKSMDMVNRAQTHLVLTLPHVVHLSLKNCWISPHIMTRFLSSLRKSDLQTITFDSVSLTAHIVPGAAPNALNQAGAAQVVQIAAGQAAAAQNVAGQGQAVQGLVAQAHAVHAAGNAVNLQAALNNAMNPQNNLALPHNNLFGPPQNNPWGNGLDPDDSSWLDPPRVGSWANIIDTLTPGQTLEGIRYDRGIPGAEPALREPTKLSKIEFKSCGYVQLPLDFNQVVLEYHQGANQQNAAAAKRASDLESYMMKPLDSTLGTIINHFPVGEKTTLENAWNISFGNWALYRPELYADCLLDGISNPGRGRFDGLIEATRLTSSNDTS